MSTMMIEEVACASAEEFIDEMNPAHGKLWAGASFRRRDWIFRGVRCATWGLRPSAFRGDAFARFQVCAAEPSEPPDAPVPEHQTAKEQRDLEDSLVVDFCSMADKAGVTVPGDSPELRDSRLAILDYEPHRFPPINKLHMYALAQHYGIPTRLLDWTSRPMVAAYFAVERVAMVRSNLIPGEVKSEDPCAVWALDAGFVEEMVRRKLLSPAIHLVTAPKATNPNLGAQGGLFTLVQPSDGDPQPLPNIETVLEENASKVPENLTASLPILYKFTLPAKETNDALRMLAVAGVHAGSLYPGLEGVVKAMRERKAHHWNEPKHRR